MIKTAFQTSVLLLTTLATTVFASESSVLTKAQRAELQQLTTTASTSDLSYQIVESLTTEVGARMIGTEGDKRAIKWAVDKMNALGFDKVWTEEVAHFQWIRGDVEAKITAPFPQPIKAIALGESVGTGEQGIEADVVHFATLADLEAADATRVDGKIVFVSYRMERLKTGRGYGKAVGARVRGASVAAEKGAVGFIMRSVGTANNRLAHTGITRYQNDERRIPAVALSNPDADLLINQLKRNKPVRFFLKVTAMRNEVVTVKGANVIGEITGSQWPEQIVALGAHLDSWDVGTGAIDDGLGVGMVMATAAHIGQLDKRPKRTIRVILFAGEEVGLLGAKQYLIDHQATLKDHVIAAEWDFGLGKIYSMQANVAEPAIPAIDELASYLAPLGVAYNTANQGRGQSDMGLITDQGVPAMNFTPDGLRYFDIHHTENDTLDKVVPEDLQQNTAVYTIFAYFAAQADVEFRKAN
ncbi:M20/M25/M40 family metallo-hydrolase [Thalassotalea ponticola]|uniref:M20/M25/M40 family metallo-hydrolase n=1 Tax=Thalassotalea ponticola TaxID=1523392 RepID=UPI0025B5A6AC|nr:M20/M25/M40 family metallo-hydrolase [Thalassotalea ponticola]MDN3653485.1 M20/M25/M40 family metallo-hydrolase [Thalassotalea ponticola]